MPSRLTAAKRLREFRLLLGYGSAASFARDIGLPPARIYYYERVGFNRAMPMLSVVRVVNAKFGGGALCTDWLAKLARA